MIERTFGVWKNKRRIIRNMPSFSFHIQILIVSATMALHNFVKLNDRDDMGFINANRVEENIIVKQVAIMSKTQDI